MIKRFRFWKEIWKTFLIINVSTFSTILPRNCGVSTTEGFCFCFFFDHAAWGTLVTPARDQTHTPCSGRAES